MINRKAGMVFQEDNMLVEIADKRCTRRDVAKSMALAIRSSERDSIDWEKIGKAVIERWSPAAWAWIKEKAWTGAAFDEDDA